MFTRSKIRSKIQCDAKNTRYLVYGNQESIEVVCRATLSIYRCLKMSQFRNITKYRSKFITFNVVRSEYAPLVLIIVNYTFWTFLKMNTMLNLLLQLIFLGYFFQNLFSNVSISKQDMTLKFVKKKVITNLNTI